MLQRPPVPLRTDRSGDSRWTLVGGVVITQAGNNSKVCVLIYVAALTPDSDQSVNDLPKRLAAPAWVACLQQDQGGFLTLPADAIARYFAPERPAPQRRILAATQGAWFAGVLADKVAQAAWRQKPCACMS